MVVSSRSDMGTRPPAIPRCSWESELAFRIMPSLIPSSSRRRLRLHHRDGARLKRVFDRADHPQEIADELYKLLDSELDDASVVIAQYGHPQGFVADESYKREENQRSGEKERQTRRRPDAGQGDLYSSPMPIGISDQQGTDDDSNELPKIVHDESIKKVVQFANQEYQRHAAKQDCHGPLRRAEAGNPPHSEAAEPQNNRLDNLYRGKLTGTEAIRFVEYDVQLEATRRRNLHLRQCPRDERDSDEIENEP